MPIKPIRSLFTVLLLALFVALLPGCGSDGAPGGDSTNPEVQPDPQTGENPGGDPTSTLGTINSFGDGVANPDKVVTSSYIGGNTSFISFSAMDGTGNAVSDGTLVHFEIMSGPGGGETVFPTQVAVKEGSAKTVFRSGTNPGVAIIRISSAADANINETLSLTIASIAPTGETFSIAATPLNIGGLTEEGLESEVTARINDGHGNTLSDHPLYFQTFGTGGGIPPGGTTNDTGAFKATLTSGGQAPIDGKVYVTASTTSTSKYLRVSAIKRHPDENNTLLAATNGTGLYKSKNNGGTWTNISAPPVPSTKFKTQATVSPCTSSNQSIAFPGGNAIFLAAGTSLYRSPDLGNSWSRKLKFESPIRCLEMQSETDYWLATEANGPIHYLAGYYEPTHSFPPAWPARSIRGLAHNSNNSRLYAVSNLGVAIWDGSNWNESSDITGDNITSIVTHPTLANVAYVGTDSYGVWKTNNTGITWTKLSKQPSGKFIETALAKQDGRMTGNGAISTVQVKSKPTGSKDEWCVKCISDTGSTFSVLKNGTEIDTLSLANGSGSFENADVAFTVTAGSTAFEEDDTFIFTTLTDPASTISTLSLFTEGSVSYLIASTEFNEPSHFPHRTGGLWRVPLDTNGNANGSWQNIDGNIPCFNPPDDKTRPVISSIEVDNPKNSSLILVGGDDLTLLQANAEDIAATPVAAPFTAIDSTFGRTIMVRMPIVFSGFCSIKDVNVIGKEVSFRVSDMNGHSPVKGSTVLVKAGSATKTFTYMDTQISTLESVTFDTQIASGTDVTLTYTPGKDTADHPDNKTVTAP